MVNALPPHPPAPPLLSPQTSPLQSPQPSPVLTNLLSKAASPSALPQAPPQIPSQPQALVSVSGMVMPADFLMQQIQDTANELKQDLTKVRQDAPGWIIANLKGNKFESVNFTTDDTDLSGVLLGKRGADRAKLINELNTMGNLQSKQIGNIIVVRLMARPTLLKSQLDFQKTLALKLKK